MNLEVITVLHYLINFVHYSSTTVSKTAPEHDAATMRDSFLQKACQCGQLQISIEFEGVHYGAGVSFSVGTLHGDVKLVSLWTVVLLEYPWATY